MLKSEYLDAIEKINTHCVLNYQIDNAFFEIKHLAEQYEREHHEQVLTDLLKTFFFDWNGRDAAMNEVIKDTFEDEGWRGVYYTLNEIDGSRSVFKLNDNGYFENVTNRDLDGFKGQVLRIIQNQMNSEELADRLREKRHEEGYTD